MSFDLRQAANKWTTEKHSAGLIAYVKSAKNWQWGRLQAWISPKTHSVESGELYIGALESAGVGFWLYGNTAKRLCSYPNESWTYAPGQVSEDWENVTNEFWRMFDEIGTCAIYKLTGMDHLAVLHRFSADRGETISCLNCGKEFRRVTTTRQITKTEYIEIATTAKG